MKIASRLLLPTLLLGAPVALAQQDPLPPAAEASAASADVKHIDVSFRGSLRDALKRIAEEGGLNLIVTGELATPVEVHLRDVTAEQALRSLARTHSLRLDQDGSFFTLRALNEQEKSASVAASMPAMPPMPGMPLLADEDMDAREIQRRVRDQVRKSQRRGAAERDVVARGQSLEVKEGDSVDNAVVYGGNLTVKGHVEEDAVAFGGNLDVYGHVEGDAHAFGGNVVLHEGASVEGDASAIGGSVIREEGAWVEGSTESFGGGHLGALVANEVKDSLREEFRNPEPAAAHTEEHVEREESSGSLDGVLGFILRFAALFGLGFLGQLFFPARMKELSAEISRQPLKSGLTGLVGFIALIPITAVLAITIIGIPVVVALWLVVPIVAALGLAVLASEIGLRVPVLRGRKTQAAVLALGLLVLLTVGSIPVIGALAMALATMVAFGAVIRTRFGHKLRGVPEPLTPNPAA
ncbi:bactofilin family protein [Hyalangium gracile]|uniref:polymer-forming cytoskeletal protein n=1 Tax=Hyalangium gracile TaxID=394092 RepID=UPI001CCA16BC|nr:polymer-forming cytoskeletal protein [Hyalangium gracile]